MFDSKQETRKSFAVNVHEHSALISFGSRLCSVLVVTSAALLTVGCATTGTPFTATSGPSSNGVAQSAKPENADSNIVLVDLTNDVVRRALAVQRRQGLRNALGDAPAPRMIVGAGDSLEVSVWEAPPAALFGFGSMDVRGMPRTSTQATVLPEQVVTAAGSINMPFVGTVAAAGRSLGDIEQEIARRLKGKANDPQVLVRIVRNASSIVTVVGEVTTSTRMPLTPRGERLLDALAAAGGTRQPVGKLTLQVTRAAEGGARVAALPLETIIADPSQNIVLQPGDVVTALYQPNSLTLLGASAKNEEMNFEAQGISLAQTLARAGGLQDQRADPAGVFIFRFEDPKVFKPGTRLQTTPEGKVPVIYKVNLRDPATFFMAQDFPMRNRDVVYIANAPSAELQKFLNLISSIVLPTVTVDTLMR